MSRSRRTRRKTEAQRGDLPVDTTFFAELIFVSLKDSMASLSLDLSTSTSRNETQPNDPNTKDDPKPAQKQEGLSIPLVKSSTDSKRASDRNEKQAEGRGGSALRSSDRCIGRWRCWFRADRFPNLMY